MHASLGRPQVGGGEQAARDRLRDPASRRGPEVVAAAGRTEPARTAARALARRQRTRAPKAAALAGRLAAAAHGEPMTASAATRTPSKTRPAAAAISASMRRNIAVGLRRALDYSGAGRDADGDAAADLGPPVAHAAPISSRMAAASRVQRVASVTVARRSMPSASGNQPAPARSCRQHFRREA
jgi:hypothetical protein